MSPISNQNIWPLYTANNPEAKPAPATAARKKSLIMFLWVSGRTTHLKEPGARRPGLVPVTGWPNYRFVRYLDFALDLAFGNSKPAMR